MLQKGRIATPSVGTARVGVVATATGLAVTATVWAIVDVYFHKLLRAQAERDLGVLAEGVSAYMAEQARSQEPGDEPSGSASAGRLAARASVPRRPRPCRAPRAATVARIPLSAQCSGVGSP
jgi:hypothetical protein